MRSIFKAAAISMVATTALAGSIDFEAPPVVSGEVTTFEDRHQVSELELTAAQLHAIAKWLHWNRQGWFATRAKNPAESIQLQLNLRHSDGTLAVVDVVADAGGKKHHLFFINGGAPWSYHAWFGKIRAPAATRPLADYELEVLTKIVSK